MKRRGESEEIKIRGGERKTKKGGILEEIGGNEEEIS